MRVRSNPTVIFEDTTCDEISMTRPDNEEGAIEIEQGGERVWVPIAEALAFADALKAYAEELAA
jgi:hypothetical protein